MSKKTTNSRAIIDLSAYAHNLHVVRSMVPRECAVMPVVKANAYGHGAVPLAKRAVAEGFTRMLGVATVAEAIELRDAGIDVPILVLVQPPEEALFAAVEYQLRITVSDGATAEHIGELGRRSNKVLPIHCKIDTGMGREGIGLRSALNELLFITRISHVDIEGVCTHFATADDARDPFTLNQIREFRQALRQVSKEGIPYEMVHAANSGAIVNFPTSTFDMVRPGLMTFGVWPAQNAPQETPLKPVMRWESQINLIKELSRGDSIGYGRTFTAAQDMRTAVVPVGYADGFKVRLGNNADVLIRGRRCPVRGRVSMDQIVVDVTDLPGAVKGDVVTLMGYDGKEVISATELAERAGTVPNDILTGIGWRVQRVYTE